VLVYSLYSPFRGAGLNIGGWSFAIDMEKGKQDVDGKTLQPQDFQVSELYECITAALLTLKLPEMSIDERLYANGQEIRNDRRFLRNEYSQPNTQVDKALMEHFKEQPTQNLRYYQCIRVTSWQGELVLSIFVRFVRIGKHLFAEANYRLLVPVHEAYYVIDTIDASWNLRKVLQLCRDTFLETPMCLLLAPKRVFDMLTHSWLLQRRRDHTRRLITDNPAFDFGSITSVRELASSDIYRRHFQRLDKEMYLKIIQHQLLESALKFLDEHDIDTAEFREQQNNIINNSTIISGGTFNGENIAVGQNAQAGSANPGSTTNNTGK
jgi:hypothetical protein